ncbi:hypothetical protein HKCCE3408_15625 [Rhodobacterales bacterium HKCCE3408]|nr:hypothetical protein [Rhodobacterales bacterium HKCCE3408]
MTRSAILVLLALWLGAVAASVAAMLSAPALTGGARGDFWIVQAAAWQIVAAVLALGLVVGRRWLAPGDGLRTLALLPVIAAALFLVGVLAVMSGAYSR